MRYILFFVYALFCASNAWGLGLCPASYPELDHVAIQDDVDPSDLKTVIGEYEGKLSKEEVTHLYKCLTSAAPNNLEKYSSLPESQKQKVRDNLRKLVGFMNNIPAGSRKQAGIPDESMSEISSAPKSNSSGGATTR